ncbi:MAG: ATP-binding protein [Chloroflexi bacterium]|nr:ATP-binding protein [Chloroflexota bacterium]
MNCNTEWRYLQAEFARIDIIIQREVRRWVLAGQDPNDDYRGLYVTQLEAQQLLDRPFGVSWGQLIELPAEEETAFQQALAVTKQQIETLAQGQTPRLLQLANAFELDRMALDILLLCLAPAFDTRYERIYGYLQDNVTRRRPSVRLLLDLLGEPGMAQFTLSPYLSQAAPLFKHELLELIVEAPPANAHWINQTLNVDETVTAWLRGEYQPHAALKGQASLVQVEVSETDQLLAGGALQRIQETTNRAAYTPSVGEEVLLVFYGVDATAQAAAAHCLAAEAKQPLLLVQLDRVIGESCPPRQAVKMALRDARLTGAMALLNGWDACLDEDRRVAPDVLTVLCDHPGSVIVAGQKQWQAGGIARQRTIVTQAFDLPSYEQRLALWRHYLTPWQGLQSGDSALTDLAGQFALTTGQIRDAVTAARDQAIHTGRTPGGENFLAAARAYSNPRLSTLARKIEPRYGWDDLILPGDQWMMLHELPQVLESWGVGKKLAASAGISALFAGPPGTGKTMAAEVIAHALGLALYKIDLSTIVSKYIGETEKNLEHIFAEATSSNAILFFDEADALFGKRSEVKDAHDRFANIEISYLLQRMENYDGVAILATNLRANLDDAFTRRLHFIVAFPFPQRAERRRIWETLFPPGVPRAELDFDKLAQRFELAGGNIRNAIMGAAYLAASNGQVVTMAHLLHGVKRELQKMGRMVGDGEFG